MTLWQADPRWSKETLGHGPSTIGRGGCLLTVLTEAATLLTHRPGLIPPMVNATLKATPGAFIKDRLDVEVAARALGMVSPARERDAGPSGVVLRDAIDAALCRGFAILHVDHDGVDGGDHFVLATGRGPLNEVDCIDPAPAHRILLGWPDLEAPVFWGKKLKRYRVVAVRPLRALPV